MKYHEIKKLTRRLRRNQTPCEAILWSHLRNKQLLGRKFLRQHPIIYESNGTEHFFYVADFYCRKERLVIELDGPIHRTQIERDTKRDLILNCRDLKVLRIKNKELSDIEKVLMKIIDEFN